MRAILFDFNGVLVDDEPLHLELLQAVLAEEGLARTAEEIHARCTGIDDRSAFAQMLVEAGEPAPPHRLARLVARKSAYYQQRIRRDGYPVFAGAAELVAATAADGWVLGVVTGALRHEVEDALEQLGLRSLFKVLVAAEDVSRGKPDPEGYRRGLHELNSRPPLPERLLHPHQVVAVEDTPPGLQAARAVGLVTVAVAQTYPAEHLEMADLVVGSIAGLSPARLRTLVADGP